MMDTGINMTTRRWTMAYLDLTVVPADLCEKFGPSILDLDLSHNRLTEVRFLVEFPNLNTLVLDHNELQSHVKLPPLPALHTLWINNNQIKNLSVFIDTVASSCPKLRYLSMMNNEAAPSFFNGGTKQQYADFRFYVISQLPLLEMLDFEKVTPEERAQARQYYTRLSSRKKKKSVEPSVRYTKSQQN